MSALTGEDLTCVRGERIVFRHVSFHLEAGDALVLTGANGSGKSSLLRMIAGLLRAESGRIVWDGVDISRDREDYNLRLQLVGHLDAAKPALTVLENVKHWANIRSGCRASEDGCRSALATFGLERLADVPARYLSAGQRRRLALSRLLSVPATLWLLDEPRTALDADASRRLDDVLAAHRATGGIMVIAQHGAPWPSGAHRLDLGRNVGSDGRGKEPC